MQVLQNGAMVSKVVLNRSADGGGHLRVAPVLTASSAHEPVAPGTELHLGSQDLVRLTSYAMEQGYVVYSYMISDSYLEPLPEDEQLDISKELVRLLKEFGAKEVEAALDDEYDGLYVVGVELIDPKTGMMISIRRRGFVETAIVQEAEVLLQSAWRELHLS